MTAEAILFSLFAGLLELGCRRFLSDIGFDSPLFIPDVISSLAHLQALYATSFVLSSLYRSFVHFLHCLSAFYALSQMVSFAMQC